MSSLFESKSMKLVVLTMAFILAVFAVAVVAEALGVRVPYVGEVLAALTGNAGIGTARNTVSDGIMPRWESAQQAKAAALTPAQPITIPGGPS